MQKTALTGGMFASSIAQGQMERIPFCEKKDLEHCCGYVGYHASLKHPKGKCGLGSWTAGDWQWSVMAT